MLVCKVAMGGIHVLHTYEQVKKLPNKCHSLHYDGDVPEYVVFDDRQVSNDKKVIRNN
jgi:hypothetical protein